MRRGLVLGDERDRFEGRFDAGSADEPIVIEGSSADLTDGYYQFYSEKTASWFGLDYVADVQGIRDLLGEAPSRIWDDDARSWIDTPTDVPLVATFRGLPMGWSWSLYFCHDVVSQCMATALRTLGLRDELAVVRQPPPTPSRAHPVCAPCVDNANLLTITTAQRLRVYPAVLHELQSKGFKLRDLQSGETLFTFLGMVWDADRRTLGHTRKRCWRLYYAIQ